jgi:deaminated glutathione amidase
MSTSNIGAKSLTHNNRKIAVAQLCSTSSKVENLVSVAKCAGWAKRDKCTMLFLPECFGFIGESSEQTLQSAEPPIAEESPENDANFSKYLEEAIDDCSAESEQVSRSTKLEFSTENISLLSGLKRIARRSNLWISAGGMHVRGAPPRHSTNEEDTSIPRVYNTHVIVDNQGNLQCYYRKIHLFDVSIPGKVNLRESATTAPGTELKVCDTPVGKMMSMLLF